MPQAKEEWPLVLFTIIAPAAVGAGVVLSCNFKQHQLSPTVFHASLALFGMIAAAFLISAVHIGRRLRMPRAIFNLLRSWLSREIFLMSGSCTLFLAAAVMYFFREKYRIEPRFVIYAFWLGSAVGLSGVFSMQRVYVLRSVRLWTGSRGISMLVSTAFLLGTMVAVLILHASAKKSVEDLLWWLYLVFFGPLLLDALQLLELRRLRRNLVVFLLGCTRLPVYLTLLHALGRVEIIRLVTVMALAFAGDVVLRLFFFGEQVTDFRTEMDRARRLRLSYPDSDRADFTAAAGPGGGRS